MTPYDANDDAVSRNPETVNRDTSAVPSREEAEAAVEVLLRWAGDCLLYTSPSPRDS